MSPSLNKKGENMSEDNKATLERQKKRRIRVDNSVVQKTEEYEIRVVPTIEQLVEDGLSIIGSELSKYRKKTSKGVTLDLKEARVVTSYIEALTKMTKEAREASKPAVLQDLSDEDLLKMLQDSVNNTKKNHDS